MWSHSPFHSPSVVVVVVLGSIRHEMNVPDSDIGQKVILLHIDAAAADKAAAAADKAAASADKPSSAAVLSLCCSYLVAVSTRSDQLMIQKISHPLTKVL